MPKRRNSEEIGVRSTHYCPTKKMWVLQTLNSEGKSVVEDQYMKSKTQAEAWVAGDLGEGNCYEIASKILFSQENEKEKFTLCHGTVVGQGPITGAIFGHAWLEYNQKIPTLEGLFVDLNMVLDQSNGKNTSMPRDLYYKIGQITKVKKYSKEKARKMLLHHMTYGPWE